MVNYCVCVGCTNSSLSGHRVHRFPNKKKDGGMFRAWVRFVQVMRRDFTSASASRNAVVCSVHFTPEDYRPGHMMQFNMGCRSHNQVRFRSGAVPSGHTAPPSSGQPSSCASAAGGKHAHGSVRDTARRKRELCTVLGDTANNKRRDASTASAVVLTEPEVDAVSPLAPQSSVLHFGSQCNLRPSHRSSGMEAQLCKDGPILILAVQAQPKMVSVGTQTQAHWVLLPWNVQQYSTNHYTLVNWPIRAHLAFQNHELRSKSVCSREAEQRGDPNIHACASALMESMRVEYSGSPQALQEHSAVLSPPAPLSRSLQRINKDQDLAQYSRST